MHVALLRGINVGGRTQLAMADLREMFAALGFEGARSLLQSGNLIFTGGRRSTTSLETLLEKATAERLGMSTDYLVRTAAEWHAAIAANPFPEAAARDPGHLVITCLKKSPASKDVKSLQAAIRGPEVVSSNGNHLYIVYPDGIGRSKLTLPLIEKTLGTRGTARNWNTALKIAAAMSKP